MLGSSLESTVGISDFTISEFEFFGALVLLDDVHGIMLSLFSLDLFGESSNGVKNSGNWSSSGKLGLDLSEERGIGQF